MVRVRLKRSEATESDYLYKVAMECFGRTVEFGLSQKEFAKLRDMSKTYFDSFRKTIKRKPGAKLHTSKKASNRDKEAEVGNA